MEQAAQQQADERHLELTARHFYPSGLCPEISDGRLLEFNRDEVAFRWKDYRRESRRKVMRLAGDEFVRRFLLHVLPFGFQRMRHYGLLADRSCEAKLQRCRDLLQATASAPVHCPMGVESSNGLLEAVRELWTYRRLLLPLTLGMVTISMADAAAAIWAVPVLTRSFHQTPADFGTWMGLLTLGAGLAGNSLGGFSADYGQRLAGRAGVLLGALAGALLSIPAAFFPMMPSVPWFAVLMGLLLLTGACVGVACTAAVATLVPNNLRGVSLSLLTALAVLMAFGIAPSLVSLTAQAMGRGDDIRLPLTLVGVATSVVGAASFISAVRAARGVQQTWRWPQPPMAAARRPTSPLAAALNY